MSTVACPFQLVPELWCWPILLLPAYPGIGLGGLPQLNVICLVSSPLMGDCFCKYSILHALTRSCDGMQGTAMSYLGAHTARLEVQNASAAHHDKISCGHACFGHDQIPKESPRLIHLRHPEPVQGMHPSPWLQGSLLPQSCYCGSACLPAGCKVHHSTAAMELFAGLMQLHALKAGLATDLVKAAMVCFACRRICRTGLRCGTSPWRVLRPTLPKFWSFISILWSRSIVPAQARALYHLHVNMCVAHLVCISSLQESQIHGASAGAPFARSSVALLVSR